MHPDSLLICLVFVAVLALAAVLWSAVRTGALPQVMSSVLRDFETSLATRQNEIDRLQEVKSSALRTELAQSLMDSRKELAEGLGLSRQAVETRLGQIETRLQERLEHISSGVQGKLEANIKEGFITFSKIQEQLQQSELRLQEVGAVGRSISELNNLLKLPHLRGGFGETTLERMLADFLPAHLYELQYRIVPGSTERVDAVIKYPNAVLPIDSKFPREQVLALFEGTEGPALESARKTFADLIRQNARSISEKYIHPEHGTAEMALLFVPSETLYFEMLRNPKICEDLRKLRVFAVSPNTLAVTLQAVDTSRRYYEMARGVEKTIEEVRKARLHLENFERRFQEVGTALNKSQSAFQMASTHLTRYSGAVTRLTGELQTGTELGGPESVPSLASPA